MNNFYIDDGNRFQNTYFGGYDTRTLSNIFPNVDSLKNIYITFFGEPEEILANNWTILYAILMGRYADSHIKSYSEDKFKLRLCTFIYEEGINALKKYDLQKKIRNITEEELQIGNTAIYNHAAHDASEPSDQSVWESNYVNNQDVTKYKKSKLNTYIDLYSTLHTGAFDIFLEKCRKLFTSFGPSYPLIYFTEDKETE